MSVYRYTLLNPQDDKGHYFYSQFEGSDLLHSWSDSRGQLLSCLSTASKSFPNVVIPDLPFLVDFESNSVLEACAVLICSDSDNFELLDQWSYFVSNKIELHHRLRFSYNSNGRMLSNADSPQSAYAYASFLLGWKMSRTQSNERFKWFNSLLKCLDIFTFISDVSDLDEFPSYCARIAIELERNQFQYESSRLGISL